MNKIGEGNRSVCACALAAAYFICVSSSAAEARDLFADTWDAMDDLGRSVASAGLPAPRAKKVGIFYWTWHQGRKGPVLDNSKLLAEDPTLPQRPQDPKWGLRKPTTGANPRSATTPPPTPGCCAGTRSC